MTTSIPYFPNTTKPVFALVHFMDSFDNCYPLVIVGQSKEHFEVTWGVYKTSSQHPLLDDVDTNSVWINKNFFARLRLFPTLEDLRDWAEESPEGDMTHLVSYGVEI